MRGLRRRIRYLKRWGSRILQLVYLFDVFYLWIPNPGAITDGGLLFVKAGGDDPRFRDRMFENSIRLKILAAHPQDQLGILHFGPLFPLFHRMNWKAIVTR